MLGIPFVWRVAALLAVSVIAVLLDRRKPVDQRHRWREYSVLLLAAAAGVLTGMSIDAVTSTVSPEYFLYGKGITAGASFRHDVLSLGAQAGASAGVLGGAVLLLANPEPRRAFSLLRCAWFPIAGAVVLAILFGLAQSQWGLVTMQGVDEFLDPQAEAAFTTVWVTHLGVYSGALLGLLAATMLVRKGKIARSSTTDRD